MERIVKKNEITLSLPIEIRRTVAGDGYVIVDAKGAEHYFYSAGGKLVYDGWCEPMFPEESK